MAEKTELLEEDEKVVEIELERLRGFENHTGFSGLQVLRCVVINFDSVLKTVLNQCHLQVIFIHVLIKFYAVLEECMSVEENLRKILMMLEW